MSLSQLIKSRMLQDVINEGLKIASTGTVVGAVTNQVLFALPPKRAVIVCGFSLSTSTDTAVLVSLGFKNGASPTKVFFTGYVSNSGGPLVVNYQLGDWYRGDANETLVITTSGPAAWTVDTRVTDMPTTTGYIEHEAAELHSGRAFFPQENGIQRGQSEV